MNTPDLSQAAVPGLLRRLSAIFYDSLLIAAVLFIAAGIALIANFGEPIEEGTLLNMLYRFYMFSVVFLYFGWHWTHGGQTLGMRAWRLRLLRNDGKPLSWGDCLKRFLAAVLSLLPLGLGLIWILLDSDNLAWHDRLSKTRLVLQAKR